MSDTTKSTNVAPAKAGLDWVRRGALDLSCPSAISPEVAEMVYSSVDDAEPLEIAWESFDSDEWSLAFCKLDTKDGSVLILTDDEPIEPRS